MRHLTALFLSMCLLGIGHGLGTSLLGIRSTIEDFSDLAAGIALSGFYVGFLAGSRFVGSLLANVGHIRVFAGLAALMSSVMLLHSLIVSPAAWFMLRLAAGFCISGIYITADSWFEQPGHQPQPRPGAGVLHDDGDGRYGSGATADRFR